MSTSISGQPRHQNWRLLAGAIVCSLLFLVAGYLATHPSNRFDEQLLMAVYGWSNPALDVFFQYATHLGSPIVIGAIGGLAGVYYARQHDWRLAAVFLLGVVGAVVLTMLLKDLYGRARPDLWQTLISETSLAFPSGHAMASMALAAAGVYASTYRNQKVVLLLAALYVGLVGVSRLYLGVHFPSDVVGGWLAALSWLLLIMGLVGSRLVRPFSA